MNRAKRLVNQRNPQAVREEVKNRDSSVEKELNKYIDKEVERKLGEALYNLSLSFALALHDTENFGKKRVLRVMNKAFSNIECIGDGHLSYKDLQGWEEEMGLGLTEVFRKMGVVK